MHGDGKNGDSHLFSVDSDSRKGENAWMPKVARIVVPNCPHHVTQRGNNRQEVFFVDDDRVTYLDLLKEEKGEKTGDSSLFPTG